MSVVVFFFEMAVGQTFRFAPDAAHPAESELCKTLYVKTSRDGFKTDGVPENFCETPHHMFFPSECLRVGEIIPVSDRQIEWNLKSASWEKTASGLEEILRELRRCVSETFIPGDIAVDISNVRSSAEVALMKIRTLLEKSKPEEKSPLAEAKEVA